MRHIIKSDRTILNMKSKAAPYRVSDGAGLYLIANPNGSKWWRFDFTVGGKRKTISLGVYPDTGLSAARQRSDDARQLVAAGIDPSSERKASKAQQAKANDIARRAAQGIPLADSFESVAREWFAKFSERWTDGHSTRVIKRLENDFFPWIGKRNIGGISAPELLTVLRRIEERPTRAGHGALDTAHRGLRDCRKIFRFAKSSGLINHDPSSDLHGALPPPRGKHFAALTDPKQIGALLRALDGYQGSFVVQCALRLAPLVFVRPGELRKAEWSDIDLEACEWRFTVTKTKIPHIVPLAMQAVAILQELKEITGDGRYVFPGSRRNGMPMSDNAILEALRRLGIGKDEMSGHGFRAMARTILDEVLGFRPDIIEHQLGHRVRDPHGRAYNRTAHLGERKRMLQKWVDYLGGLKRGADVIAIKAAG